MINSLAFGQACAMIVKLIDDLKELSDTCRDRAKELGSLTQEERNQFSDLYNAASEMRGVFSKDMTAAYLKIYEHDIIEASKHD